MKKASEIITHVLKPFENKISLHRCLRKIISLMPENYKKYITQISYKGDVLYIKVSHPALRQEIFYKRNLIFSIIKTLHTYNLCNNINPKKIITDYQYKKPLKPPKEIKFYLKKANDFEIKAKNPEIIKKFEEIKKILKEKSEF
jgi:hypothetical protein